MLTANLLCACLVVGLAVFVTARRLPRALRLVMPICLGFVLLYVIGDAILLVSMERASEQLGIAVLYSGGLPAMVACWILAIRYAEFERLPFRRLGARWIQLPIAGAALAWLAMITNPWHGQFVTPGLVADSQYHWLWWLFVPCGYALATGSVLLYGVTARRARNPLARRNALIMACGISLILGFNLASNVPALRVPFDLTVVGFGATSALFLFGAYRSGLFSLLPVSFLEVVHHDRDGLVLVDAEGWWLHSNPAASWLLGADLRRPDTDVLALLADRLRTEDGSELAREDLADELLGGSSHYGIFLADEPNGSWWRVTSMRMSPQGTRTPAVAVWLHDVTAMRDTAEQLRHAREQLEARVSERTEELESAVGWLHNEMQARRSSEEQLRRSEERHRAISELSSDFSFAFERAAEGTLSWEWVTRAATEILGYDKDELNNRNLRFLIHPDDLGLIESEVVGPIRRGESIRVELRVRTKQGGLRWLEIRGKAVLDEVDGSVRTVGAVRDVTERKQAEEERQGLEQRIQETQRMESLGVLAGGVAHDFNNILGVILGSASLASMEFDAPDQLRQRLARICSAVDYGAKLTDQLLNYAGGAPCSLEPLDLRQVLLEMLDLLRASVPSKCNVRSELPDELPLIEADDTQIRQVIVNLVSNAGEALGENGGDVTVRVGSVRLGASVGESLESSPGEQPAGVEWVFLEVEDTGPGMDEDTRRRVFEPFFSTKQTGRGLGLAAVHGIVQRHAGEIQLETEPGRGTRFRVLFPRATSTVVQPAATVAVRSEAPARTATVLVVDDDEAILELAAEILKRAGFQMLVAGGGAEAIRIFAERADEIDAVVLDCSMPEIDGSQVLEAIRRICPGVRVVLVTGYREDPGRIACGPAERSPGYLRKPFEAEELVDRVRAALE